MPDAAPNSPRVFSQGQWSELRAFVDDHFGQGFANSDLVSRGEPECYPSVLPKIDRLLPLAAVGEASGRLIAELHAVQRFRQHAPMHLDALQRAMLEEGMQAQVVMRHYGAPTRLLDWSESPWIALYFACEDAGQPPRQTPKRGRVLAFDRTFLERKVRTDYAIESVAHAEMAVNSDGWQIPRMLTTTFAHAAREWVVCYHRHAAKFPRLIAQQGLFTIGSKPWLDHWEQIKRLCPGHHSEIWIEPGLKPEVLRRLARMGITGATLYPDIDGVCREVEAYIRMYAEY
jgi:hypothetical protein